MADVQVLLDSIEMKPHTGWMCPACHSVHAPFISACANCEASKHPRVQLHILHRIQEEISAAGTNTYAPFTVSYIERLLAACKADHK